MRTNGIFLQKTYHLPEHLLGAADGSYVPCSVASAFELVGVIDSLQHV